MQARVLPNIGLSYIEPKALLPPPPLVGAYAIGVCNELRTALKGLVEEREF